MFWYKIFRIALGGIFGLCIFSCSDPVFWVTSREQPVSKNNLPKDTQATGIALLNGYYYASVGASLWKRPSRGGQWQRVILPGFMANGVGVDGGKLYVGTDHGVYESTDGSHFTKVTGYDKAAAVYQVGNTIFFAVQDSVLGQLGIYQGGTFNNGPKYKVTGLFTGSNSSDSVSGSNGIFTDNSGNTKCLFSYVSGLNKEYLYADGKVGKYQCPSAGGSGSWTSFAGTGHAPSRGSAIFQLTTNAYTSVKALFAVYGLGYFELYEEGGTLKVRPPTSTVANKDAYQTSDLAFATITGFYENGNDIFALTSRKGLWRLSNGVWHQE